MIAAMSDTLKARLAALIEEGSCDEVEGRPFLSLCTLESEMRYGLCLRDDELIWARAQEGPSGEVLIFASGADAVRFVELVEHDRDLLEERIASAARERGLDPEAAVATLPVVTVVGGLLEGRTPLFCRQALRWLRPTELRPLRAAIAGVAEDRAMPRDVRSLAERLIVPDDG